VRGDEIGRLHQIAAQRPLSAGRRPWAMSWARMDAMPCSTLHTPQTRCVKCWRREGSRLAQDHLETAKHLAAYVGALDLVTFDSVRTSQVPLDTGEGIELYVWGMITNG